MVSLEFDQALRGPRFGLHAGLASSSLTLADPAVGTGTFLLGVLQRISQTVRLDEGEGTVSAAIHEALSRLIAFELQLGPFAVTTASARRNSGLGPAHRRRPRHACMSLTHLGNVRQ